MAERRMFAKTIIDSDAFMDMPLSTQALYFHLSMRADDEGFINSPKKIQRMIGASSDDLKLLIAKNFIIPFDSGVVVIKHWKIHNYIRKDRLVSTVYHEEKKQLAEKENGSYTFNRAEILELETTNEETPRQKAYKESSLPYSFEYKIRQAFTGKKCPICGCIMNYANNLVSPTIQHNKPISKGGKHELGNISVICRSCNASIQDNETEKLNSEEVIGVWENICQSNVSQMSVECQHRIGKDSIEENSIEIYSSDESEPNIPYKEICEYLNERTGSSYRHSTKKTKDLIKARFNEGFTLADFKIVIDKKSVEWTNTDMQKYLRPETLFGTKFESYLNQQIKERKLTTRDIQDKIDISDF